MEALAQIARLPLWRPVEAMLEQELARCHDVLRDSADDRALARTQGRAGLLKELIDLATKARS